MKYILLFGLWAEVMSYFETHPFQAFTVAGALIGMGIWIGRVYGWKKSIDKVLERLTQKVDGLSLKANSKLIQGMSPMTLTPEGQALADKISPSLIKEIVAVTPNLFFGEGRLDTLREIGRINDFLLGLSDSNAKGNIPEKLRPAFAKICNEEGQHITSLCLVAAFRVHEQVLKDRNTPTRTPPP